MESEANKPEANSELPVNGSFGNTQTPPLANLPVHRGSFKYAREEGWEALFPNPGSKWVTEEEFNSVKILLRVSLFQVSQRNKGKPGWINNKMVSRQTSEILHRIHTRKLASANCIPWLEKNRASGYQAPALKWTGSGPPGRAPGTVEPLTQQIRPGVWMASSRVWEGLRKDL